MKLRPAVTLVLLLTFPASTLAQGVAAAPQAGRSTAPEPSGRLNLNAVTTSLAAPLELPRTKPFVVRMPTARPHAFEQSPAQQSCADSESRGRTDADARPMNKGAFFGSLAAGAVFPVYGIGGATAITATVKPKPKTIPAGVDAACYAQGFGSKARNENVLAALWGSLAGTAIGFIILAAAFSGD